MLCNCWTPTGHCHHHCCCHHHHHHWPVYVQPVVFPPVIYQPPLRARIRVNEPIRLTSTTRHAIKALAGRKG